MDVKETHMGFHHLLERYLTVSQCEIYGCAQILVGPMCLSLYPNTDYCYYPNTDIATILQAGTTSQTRTHKDHMTTKQTKNGFSLLYKYLVHKLKM